MPETRSALAHASGANSYAVTMAQPLHMYFFKNILVMVSNMTRAPWFRGAFEREHGRKA